jgi:hypothetical protein
MHGAVHFTIPNGRIAVESWKGVEQKSIYIYDPVMAWSMMGFFTSGGNSDRRCGLYVVLP